MAYIDELYAMACSLEERDADSIVRLCQLLYRRVFYGDFGSHILGDPSECKKIRITNQGFTLSFEQKHVHYCRDGGRWLACEKPDERPRLDDPHHVAVERLSAPYAFLEGLAYGMECVDAVGMSEVENHKAKGKSHELDAALKKWLAWSREIESMQKRFRSKKFQSMARSRCARFFEEYERDTPPSPPTETTTIDAAQAAFDGISGVYFLWDPVGKIDYVGRANNIGKRLASHHVATNDHRVSIVETSKQESHLAELFYIWKFRPPKNCQSKAAASEKKSRVLR
jgi:hypothetical protein